MIRTEKNYGYEISLEKSNGLFFSKITPGLFICRGKRTNETSYVDSNSQSARERIQFLKELAKCNPL